MARSAIDTEQANVGSEIVAPRVRELTPELAELIEWESDQRRRDLRRAELLAAVHAGGVTDIEHGHSTTMWLADTANMSNTAARNLVRLSVRLTHQYQALASALTDDLIGWHHIVAFDRAANPRIAAALIDLAPELIELAQVATFERWSQEIRGIAERLDQDGGYNPAHDTRTNELHLTPTVDGITHISGKLVGELAFTIRSLINAETERVMARHRADADELGPDTELPSPAQARAEALAELLERGIGVADGSGRIPQPELIVTYAANTGELTDDRGETLSPTMLRWLIAAALIRPFEITGTNDPLRMGHTLRYANREQRRALLLRDGGCIFPGCTRPAAWCDAHHVDEWDNTTPTNGGPTDIENLALLCRHHHRVTHRPGWTMTRWKSDQHPDHMIVFRWQTPTGRTIYSQRHHTRITSCALPAAERPMAHAHEFSMASNT